MFLPTTTTFSGLRHVVLQQAFSNVLILHVRKQLSDVFIQIAKLYTDDASGFGL